MSKTRRDDKQPPAPTKNPPPNTHKAKGTSHDNTSDVDLDELFFELESGGLADSPQTESLGDAAEPVLESSPDEAASEALPVELTDVSVEVDEVESVIDALSKFDEPEPVEAATPELEPFPEALEDEFAVEEVVVTSETTTLVVEAEAQPVARAETEPPPLPAVASVSEQAPEPPPVTAESAPELLVPVESASEAPPATIESAPEPAVAKKPSRAARAAATAAADTGQTDAPASKAPPPTPAKAGRAAKAAPPPPADPMPDAGPEEKTALNDHATFRAEAQRLARAREWQKLAAITSAAVDHGSWAHLPETRAALLLDLARIHRDRLGDPAAAEQAFKRLAQVDPTNDDALQYLSNSYRERGDWRAVYDLYSAAVEPTWDPNQRLAWTRETAQIATERLRSPDLAIEAWERLERLGDAVEDTYNALSEMYRRAGRWDRLAQFLSKRAAHLEGTARVVALREVAEAYLSGLHDHVQAGSVIDEILTSRPDDVIALLANVRVLAKKGAWDALAALGAKPLDGAVKKAELDFRRVVAEALWAAKQHQQAVQAFERVLELDPEDADALRCKEEYLGQSVGGEELLAFLADRAERASSVEARAELLGRAAQLADEKLDDPRQAVALWEKRVALSVGQAEAYQALEGLYERLGDLPGIARSLEGQLALTRRPEDRVPLLRRLGEHWAHRMGDDTRAEACWTEIVSIAPDDKATREELLALHRRRGDFEALDRSLAAQAWSSATPAEGLEYWRAAAQNIDDNMQDAQRVILAYQRVLDLAPGDHAALDAQVKHYRALGKRRDLIAALEAELRVLPADDTAGRTARALEVARLWEEEEHRVAAIAAYERVLRWDPTDETALAGLAQLRTGKEVGAAIAAFEVAAAVRGARGDREHQIKLLRGALALTDKDDKLGRFYTLRRILWLSDCAPTVLAEVEKAAEEAGAWAELAAIYRTLASGATEPAVRAARHRSLARLYEEQLKDPVRAFLVLQASERRPIDDADTLAALARLADTTGRHEDLLAILDNSAGAEAPPQTRGAMLRQRVDVLEKKLNDPARAFAECARLLQLDPHDAQALADVRRLAEAKGLWRALDALYAELWDRAGSDTERIDVARERHAVRKDKLSDAIGALDQLLVTYRLDPAQAGLGDRLLEDAEREDAWDRVLPIIEAQVRAVGEGASPDDLHRLAGLHEQRRKDLGHAFELYAEAFMLRPTWKAMEAELGRIAEQAGRQVELAGVYRVAAARAEDQARKLELLAHVTHIHTAVLKDPNGALDAHRRILQLDPSALSSLEVVIERHREAGEWRELRDRLQQWNDHAPADEQVVRLPRLLEIAHISYERLADPETALLAYSRVLDLDPANEEASAGVRSLAAYKSNPRFELRRLRIELPRATATRRVELQLACARIEHQQLGNIDGAIRTLQALVAETGAEGPGFEPLAQLLREKKDWAALVDLMEARADKLTDATSRVDALEQAVDVAERHLDSAPLERKEQLYRKLLDARPDDLVARRRLLTLYRENARHEALAQLLRDSVAALASATGASADERRGYERELVRVLAHPLGNPAEAEAVMAQAAAEVEDPERLLGRAHLTLRRNDFAAYLELRLQHARTLPPQHASLVLCHLAEACDEQPGQQLRVAGLYREARTLDPQNPFAMEALKAIGRRAKNWRQQAALLSDEDEAKLSYAERAQRLKAHGDAALATDGAKATDLYLRAVAVDPDCYAAWDALAKLRAAAGDAAGALEAQKASLYAWERATPPGPQSLLDQAARIFALGRAFGAAGDAEAAARLSLRAHRLAPHYAAAAIAVADQHLADGDQQGAFALYDRVLRDKTGSLDAAERLRATYQRGALAWRLGRRDEGISDLRAALALDPLHAGALQSLAEAQAENGRIASAAEHYVQGLLVESASPGRASLYGRLGRLWEDELKNPEEAGVCYDHAIRHGGTGDVPDLMTRALHHYRRQGRTDRALAVIEQLLPQTTEPRELASLWTERGGILASTGDEDPAVEAYDMALSYDPGNRAAIAGLSQILERRGDWEQLSQIYEARTETGSPEERAEALRALARMALVHLQDTPRAIRYLKSVIELSPTREDYEQLLEIYGDDAQHFEERLSVIAGLLALSGPFMPRVIEFGRGLFAQGERRWAWAVLSPLMNATLSDPQLKATVLELRKEFEKTENSVALSPGTHAQARPQEAQGPLADIIAELDELTVLGRATLEEAGVTSPGKLDERTAIGKTFAGIAQRLGLEGTQLTRSQELGEPFVILDGPADARHVVVKAELLQLLSVAETAFLFSTLLELTRPGVRLLASLSPVERALLVPALFAAAGVSGVSEGVPAGAERLIDGIKAGVPAETLSRWGEALRGLGGEPQALGEKLWAGQLETARRVGLVAAADLRFAARVLTRLDESLPKLQTVGRIDDLDEFIGAAAPVRMLLGFAATPLFGKLLRAQG